MVLAPWMDAISATVHVPMTAHPAAAADCRHTEARRARTLLSAVAMASGSPEVAGVFRRYGEGYRPRDGVLLSTAPRAAMRAIELCRTATLGGHVERCNGCGHQRIAYNSCLMGKSSNGELAWRCPPVQ